MFSKNRIFLIVIVMLLSAGLTGCGMRSLVVRGSRSNLLNKTNSALPESNIRQNISIAVNKWGPEYKVITGYTEAKEPTVKTLRNSTGSGLSSVTVIDNGKPMPIYASVWKESKSLSAALKKIGYAQADFNKQFQNSENHVEKTTDYSIEGSCPMGLGPNIAPVIIWDIIMAAPSVFLPVPIMGNYTGALDIKIYDGQTGELLSEINENLDYRIKGLWIWGFIKTAMPAYENDIYGTIAMIIDKELIRLETMKN